MLAQMIQQIQQMADDARGVEVLKVDTEPGHVYFLVGPDGIVKRFEADPPYHRETLLTPMELASFIREHAEPAAAPTVFISPEAIRFVYNLETRRDVATCPLVNTKQWQAMESLATSGVAFTQRDLIRFLRITMRGCLPAESALLGIIRNMRWSQGGEVQANIQHGRESLGKSLNAVAMGTAEIPEEFQLVVPVFEGDPFRARVGLALEILPEEQQFRVTPYPSEVAKGQQEALEALSVSFSTIPDVDVFLGKP